MTTEADDFLSFEDQSSAEAVAELLRGQGVPARVEIQATLPGVLYSHPQVYVDVGIIVFQQPRPEFYRYLRTIVEAGFGKRVMFGSDQVIWPGMIERAVAVIEEAPFLSEEQERDILYNNAARFLRLTDEEIAEHHGR